EVTSCLVVVAEDHRAGRLHPALRRGEAPGQDVEQRGLPRSVGPDDRQPAARLEVDVEPPEEPWRSVPEAVAEAVAGDHLVAEPGRGGRFAAGAAAARPAGGAAGAEGDRARAAGGRGGCPLDDGRGGGDP